MFVSLPIVRDEKWEVVEFNSIHILTKRRHWLWHFVLLFLLFSDFAQKLAGALSHNPASTLHTLNLSNNSLEDKG